MTTQIKLKHIAKFVSGVGFPEDMQGANEGDYPFMKVSDINGSSRLVSEANNHVSKGDVVTMGWRPISPGSILMAKIGAALTKNHRKVLTIPALIDNNMLAATPNNVDKKFFYWLWKTIDLTDHQNISSVPSVNMESLKNMRIELPTPKEQSAIANYLDSKTQTLDKILTAKNHLLDLLEAQKRAAIFNLTTRGVDSSATFRTVPEEWLGSVPESWQQTYLMGCAYERKKKNYPGNIPTLLSLSYGKLITKDIQDNGGLLPESFDTYQLITAGQIVLRLTDLQNDHKSLRVGYATQDGMITSAYSCVTAKDEVLPKYLYYYLHSADLRKVFYSMGGGVRQSMKFADLKRLVMYIPDKITQQEIVDAIEVKVEQIEKLQDKVKKSINLLEEYRSSLISNVVGGKVEV